MKKIITIVFTLLILFGLSFGIAYFANTKFIDFSFFVGLVVSVIIWFFSSKGGLTSQNLDMQVQATTGYKMEQQKHKFTPNIAFFTSLTYTVVSFVFLIIHYRSYF